MKRTSIAANADPQLAGALVEALIQRGPLAGVDSDTAARFIRLCTLVELAAGDALMREDDEAAPEVYLLVEGALVVTSKNGTLARLTKAGDVVGEIAVLLSSRRTADVVAEFATRVVAIPTKVLKMPEYAGIEDGVSGAMIRDDWIRY